MLFHIDQFHVIYINCSEFEDSLFYILYCMDFDFIFFTENFHRFFHAVRITNNNWSASFINRRICKCFYRYFRSVSGRITHCNSNNWFLCHRLLPPSSDYFNTFRYISRISSSDNSFILLTRSLFWSLPACTKKSRSSIFTPNSVKSVGIFVTFTISAICPIM